MPRPIHVLIASFALAAFAACAESTAPVELEAPQFARTGGKFLFPNVTFPDGTVGFVGAHTKSSTKDGQTFTRCDYYAEDWAAHLGGYGDDTLPAADVDDADAVLAFCLSHFDDRS